MSMDMGQIGIFHICLRIPCVFKLLTWMPPSNQGLKSYRGTTDYPVLVRPNEGVFERPWFYKRAARAVQGPSI
ncbi:hypothetical protein C7436_3477 [Marinobacter nauticus]|nr:hypothetical protein C7436_3477 [Marinobacter nauticus]